MKAAHQPVPCERPFRYIRTTKLDYLQIAYLIARLIIRKRHKNLYNGPKCSVSFAVAFTRYRHKIATNSHALLFIQNYPLCNQASYLNVIHFRSSNVTSRAYTRNRLMFRFHFLPTGTAFHFITVS